MGGGVESEDGCDDDDDDDGLKGVGGRLMVPCSSRRARPEGVWRRVGRGFGGVRGVGEVADGRGWRGIGWVVVDIVLCFFFFELWFEVVS